MVSDSDDEEFDVQVLSRQRKRASNKSSFLASNTVNAPNSNLPASRSLLYNPPSQSKTKEQQDDEQTVRNLLLYQSYDGGFENDRIPDIGKLLGHQFITALSGIERMVGADKHLVLTAAIIVVLELKFQSCKDLWSLVVDKARFFVNLNVLESISPEPLYSAAKQELRDVQILRSLNQDYGYSAASASPVSGFGPSNISETPTVSTYPILHPTPPPPPLAPSYIVPLNPSMAPTAPSNPPSRFSSQNPPLPIVSASQPLYRHSTPPVQPTTASPSLSPPRYHSTTPPSNITTMDRPRRRYSSSTPPDIAEAAQPRHRHRPTVQSPSVIVMPKPPSHPSTLHSNLAETPQPRRRHRPSFESPSVVVVSQPPSHPSTSPSSIAETLQPRHRHRPSSQSSSVVVVSQPPNSYNRQASDVAAAERRRDRERGARYS